MHRQDQGESERILRHQRKKLGLGLDLWGQVKFELAFEYINLQRDCLIVQGAFHLGRL